MQLSTVTKEVERSGTFETSGFSIKQSPEVFEILSSTLYSDPVRAVVREICCNAHDAHVMVGKQDEPFEVHLPTTMDGQFWVRDFGPGLDDQSMIDLYTTYFGSNKSHSNEQIGGFGLGSKSPFALTDSFTVVSVHQGVKRSYTAHKNEVNEPCLSKLGEVKTDEPSGIKVIVPIKRAQIREFEAAAENVLKYFKVLPKINREIERPEYQLSGTNWHLKRMQTAGYYDRGGDDNVILMGNVAYPFKLDDLRFTDQEYPELREFLRNVRITLEMEIGEVKPAASREKLHINDQSNQLIVERIEAVRKEVLKNIQEQVKKQTTIWEAALVGHESSKLFGWGLQRSIRKSLTFNGKELPERFERLQLEGCQVQRYEIAGIRSTTGNVRPSKSIESIGVSKNARFLEVETENQPYPLRLLMRIRQAMDHTKDFFPEKEGFIYVVHGTKEQREKFFKQLEGCPRKNLLDFKFTPPPKAARTSTTSGARQERKLFPVNRILGWDETLAGDVRPVTEECEAESGIYIQTRMGIPIDARGERVDCLDQHIDIFKTLKLIDPGTQLYVVPTSFISITNAPGWVNLYDKVKPKFVEFHEALDPEKQQIYSAIKTELVSRHSKENRLHRLLTDLLPDVKKPRAVFKKYCEEFDRLLELTNSLGVDYTSEVNRLASAFGLPRKYARPVYHYFFELEETQKLRDLRTQIEEKHAFLNQVLCSFGTRELQIHRQVITDYLMTKEI